MADPVREPAALHDRAINDLSFIRKTMEGAASFTDVSGLGLVAVGLTALVAAVLAHRQATLGSWLAIWFAEAALAVVLSLAMMYRKSRRRRADGPALSIPARKFFLGFWPAILAGAVLSVVQIQGAALDAPLSAGFGTLPGTWLLLYGVGVITAGAFSVRPVPVMGICFLLLGTVALLDPTVNVEVWLAGGFGFTHIVFGGIIARRHGG